MPSSVRPLYNNFCRFAQARFGGEVRRICIDGGFTCPNRDGHCGVGGCVFCGADGAGERIDRPQDSIGEQVRYHLARYANRPGVDRFAVYFQAYTSTYAPVDELRRRYDSALIDKRICALIVATRPDCVDDSVVALLSEYVRQYWVCVELGLQTASDRTAARINRGCDSAVFTQAVERLNRAGIDVTAHVMAGLPGEDEQNFLDTVDFVNSHDIHGIKLHALYVMKGTPLAQMFTIGAYTPLSLNGYARMASEAIARLRPEMVVHRISGDCRSDLLLAPDWCARKRTAVACIRSTMQELGYWQGCKWSSQAVHD